MLVKADRLQTHLARQGLAGCYLVFGDEPLQRLESIDAIRTIARQHGISERLVFEIETGFDWGRLLAETGSLSLFASRRLIELRFGAKKPDKNAAEVIQELAAKPAGEDVVVISTETLDQAAQNGSWFKAVDAKGVIVPCRVLDYETFKRWITERCSLQGKRLSAEAAELIAIRAEGNLLAAAQEIEKLGLIITDEHIGAEQILAMVTDTARHDLFKLIDVVLTGNAAKAVRMLRSLIEEGSEPVMIGWALNRELRTLTRIAVDVARGESIDSVLGKHRVWQSRTSIVRRALQRHALPVLLRLWRDTVRIDGIIKGLRSGNAADEIECLLMALAGKPVLQPCEG